MGAPGNWHFLAAKEKRFKDLVNAEQCITGSQHQSAATWSGSSLGKEENRNASIECKACPESAQWAQAGIYGG